MNIGSKIKRLQEQGGEMTTKRQQEKREMFKKVAERRVNSALDKIESIASMSNKPHYYYTEKDAQQIIRVLQKKIKELEVVLKPKKNQSRFYLT